MSKTSELYALRRSFSGDRQIEAHHRSGDSEGGGAILWDYVASTQSAEADIIDEEEHAEQREAKRRFARLLGLYFKKILSPIEFKFLTACIRSNKTPYAVGRALGVEYENTIATINAKHTANFPKLLKLMQACGYNCRQRLDFLPSWGKYLRSINWHRLSHARHREERNAHKRQRRVLFREEINAHVREYRAANRDTINAQKRALHNKHREKELERFKRYRELNHEKELERGRQYRAAHRDEINARLREKRAAHRDEMNARLREKRAAHRDEINAHVREKRAANHDETIEKARIYRENHRDEIRACRRKWDEVRKANATPEQLEAERAKARERSAQRYAAKREEILLKQKLRRQQAKAKAVAEV